MIPRRATEADLNAALALERSAFGGHAWSYLSMKSELAREGGCFLVLEDGPGEIVGLAIGFAVADSSEILDVAVHPDRRRQGLGALLVGALERAAQAQGALESFLEVRSDNKPAIALYSGLGYAPVGLRRRYYPDGQDAIVMGRSL